MASIPAPDAPIDVAPNPAKHEQSRAQYPDLNLSAGEFVIGVIYKGAAGIFTIWFTATVAVLAAAALTAELLYGVDVRGTTRLMIALGLVVFALIVFLVAFIAANIYAANRLVVTNESIIQDRAASLFSKKEQTSHLGNIRNVNALQNGIFFNLWDYGNLELAIDTVQGHYLFTWVNDPRAKADFLTNVAEAYKTYHGVED